MIPYVLIGSGFGLLIIPMVGCVNTIKTKIMILGALLIVVGLVGLVVTAIADSI
jgi:hypothetical protein